MAKFPLYQWKKAGEGSSSIDTQNFASKIKANTFTGKNTFENTGDIVSIKRTNNSSFGIDFKKENNDRVAYIGTSQREPDKATVWGKNGLILQTTNSNILIQPGSGDVQSNSSVNWNQQVDNSLVRQWDLKYNKQWDYEGNVVQPPTESWNTTSWNWTMTGINTDGIHEFVVAISTADDTLFTFNPKIVWKNGLTVSTSNKFILDKQDTGNGIFEFIFVIKRENKFHIYCKKIEGNVSIKWVRCWVVRNNNQPWKADPLW